MGGRSSGGNVDTTKSADATMDRLSKGRVSNDKVMGLQSEMADNQLAKMIPMIEALMNQGQKSFNNNPIFGGQMPQMPQPPQFMFGPMPTPPNAAPEAPSNRSPDNRTGGSLGNLQQVPGQPVYTGPTGGMGKRPGMTLDEYNFMRMGGHGMIPRGRQ